MRPLLMRSTDSLRRVDATVRQSSQSTPGVKRTHSTMTVSGPGPRADSSPAEHAQSLNESGRRAGTGEFGTREESSLMRLDHGQNRRYTQVASPADYESGTASEFPDTNQSACKTCRQRKVRCEDKHRPRCTTCRRSGRGKCHYEWLRSENVN